MKMQPTLGLFARREILNLAMLTFNIIQACLKWSINQSDFNDTMILKHYSLWYSEGTLLTTVGMISIPFLWKFVATLFEFNYIVYIFNCSNKKNTFGFLEAFTYESYILKTYDIEDIQVML